MSFEYTISIPRYHDENENERMIHVLMDAMLEGFNPSWGKSPTEYVIRLDAIIMDLRRRLDEHCQFVSKYRGPKACLLQVILLTIASRSAALHARNQIPSGVEGSYPPAHEARTRIERSIQAFDDIHLKKYSKLHYGFTF